MQRTPAWQALLDNQRLLAEPTYKALKAAVDVDPEKAPVLDTVSTVRLLVEASVALAGHGTPLGGLGPVARCEYDVNSAVTSMAEAETRAAAVGARGVYGPYVRAVRALVVSDVDHAAPERGYRLARILYAFAAADPSCPDGVLVSITALGQASAALLGRGYHAWLEDDWRLLESHLDRFESMGSPEDAVGAYGAAARWLLAWYDAARSGAVPATQERMAARVRHAGRLLERAEACAPTEGSRAEALYVHAVALERARPSGGLVQEQLVATASAALRLLPRTRADARLAMARLAWEYGRIRPQFDGLVDSPESLSETRGVDYSWRVLRQAADLAASTGDTAHSLRFAELALAHAASRARHHLPEAYGLWLHRADGVVRCAPISAHGRTRLPGLQGRDSQQICAMLAHLSTHCESPEMAHEFASAAVGGRRWVARVGEHGWISEYVEIARQAHAAGTVVTEGAWQWRFGSLRLADATEAARLARFDFAARGALDALVRFSALELTGSTAEAFGLLLEVMPECSEATAAAVMDKLAEIAPTISSMVVPDGLSDWYSLGQAIDAVTPDWSVEALWRHHWLFKGFALGAAVQAAPVHLDEEQLRLARAGVAARVSGRGDAEPATDVHETPPSAPLREVESGICSFFDPQERFVGGEPEGEMLDRMRSLDAQVQRQVLLSATAESDDATEPARPLSDGTFLLSYYLGRHGDRAALSILAGTSELTAVKLTRDWDTGLLGMFSESGRRWLTRLEAREILELRMSLQEDDPGAALVPKRAAELLASLGEQYLGAVFDELVAGYEDGSRHLVIWPHGPLHFLPWQLLPFGGGPLANSFRVTTVPGPRLLARHEPATAATVPLLVVACPSAGVAHGWPTVHELDDQCDRVAATVPGSRRLREPEATPARLLDAIGTARWVHLAAHGDAVPHAPAFQSLYVQSAPLYAHAIHGRDFRHVEVVTLSACQSALGRFDMGDNLRGLSAALFTAGVGAVVGALWPVAAGPAGTFFTEFYGSLAADASPVRAFADAQAATRDRWPAFRDWGAFTYTGNVR